MHKNYLIAHVVFFRIGARRIKRRFRYVRSHYLRARLIRHNYRYTAAARAQIQHARIFGDVLDCLADQLLRFGTGTEHVAVYIYLISVKIGVAYYLPKRFSRLPAARHFIKFFRFGMADICDMFQLGTLFTRHVAYHPIHISLVFHHRFQLLAHMRVKFVGIESEFGQIRIRVHSHNGGKRGYRHFHHIVVGFARGQLLHKSAGEFESAHQDVIELCKKFEHFVTHAHYGE